ncbi:uncharacterized protein LOC128326179 [Hemicordylus capensis]|uniref:uncharacterized protein LOC128326179 n=1 Tax=Hemicordylus capensis TaxID=884348 RepID=UPI002302EFCE|nr:uncharacterized protein LOC128326179 [Hemicordylus capensis]
MEWLEEEASESPVCELRDNRTASGLSCLLQSVCQETANGTRVGCQQRKRAGIGWQGVAGADEGAAPQGQKRTARFCKGTPRGGSAVAYQAYFAKKGTQVLVEDPKCENFKQQPTALLLGPSFHKNRITLVCLARGFTNPWPVDVLWKKDGEAVPHLAVATDEAKSDGDCSFSVVSRLSVSAAEWQGGHTYSCQASQLEQKTKPVEKDGAKLSSEEAQLTDPFKLQLTLREGQLIFLLLVIKSFAYGTVLTIYTVYREKTGS